MDKMTKIRLWIVKNGIPFDTVVKMPENEVCLLAGMLIGHSSGS